MILRYNTDEIDNTIIKKLSINARTPYTEISKQISKKIKPLSVGTVHVRVRKLEEAGIIKGNTLIIGYEPLGFHLIAFVGILSNSRESKLVKEELKKIPNIVQLYITSGKYNLFCRIIAKDPSDARDVISKIGNIKGVLRTESTICLEESINNENRLLSNILQKHNEVYNRNRRKFS
ncbi:Lrp/AsnC family transcriptional regulator [Blattabacterium cuenoti]|uniref:Lrp/AsnC family transcriptional regulator n=1 Tax=Blattabacterium cuenoti TaxID=1653831 RepID=UPI00163C43E2|nr:Lrp/AsnC ligand binding domain-containing protein [Blattabacterium cuenoti]